MSRRKFRIKPLAHIYGLDAAPLNASPLTGQWPCMNVMVSSSRIERRWDHDIYRTFEDGDNIQAIPIFRTNVGTTYTLVLTDNNLAKVMPDPETYQYLTDTYTTGLITAVEETTPASGVFDKITGNASCVFDTSGLNPGDKFILDADHTAAGEPDAQWAEIKTIDSATQITLTGNYSGTHGTGLTLPYKGRKVYGVPTGERWTYASVAGKFCFANGSSYAQYWNGTDTYATDLNNTYCSQVRYCASFANRLITADMIKSGARNPWLVRWSKEGDPTNWTDSTSGYLEFIDSEEPIVGLGVSGPSIYVFKNTSYYVGCRTGLATSALAFPNQKKGIGLYAPYSLVHFMGTVAWMGVDDFYMMNGDTAVSIGGPIRKKFFDLISDDDAQKVFGINNIRNNEILWVVNTTDGQYVFSYQWKEDCWTTYSFEDLVTGLGGFGA